MDLIEQKAVKLLTQCARDLALAAGEGLCEEPNRELIRRLVAQVRENLDEFEDAYFDEA